MEKEKICFVLGKKLCGEKIQEKLSFILDDFFLDDITTFYFAFDNVFSNLVFTIAKIVDTDNKLRVLRNFPQSQNVYYAQNSQMHKVPAMDGVCLRNIQKIINKSMLHKSCVVLCCIPARTKNKEVKELLDFAIKLDLRIIEINS